MKTPVQGLSRPNATSIQSTYLTDFECITVYLTWRGLETSNSGGTLNGTDLAKLDNAIAWANNNNKVVKIRMFMNGAPGGQSRDAGAPAWVKAMSGVPKFRHMNSQDQNPWTQPALLLCGYWSSTWKTYATRFLNAFGVLYDGNPTIRDITISYGMMLYAEPLILDIGGVATNPANTTQTFNTGLANRHELVGGGLGYGTGSLGAINPVNITGTGAGFTDALHMQALKDGIDAFAAAFPTTPLSFSFNPYQTINTDASASSEGIALTKTKSLIDYLCNALHVRTVIENNSARPDYFTFDSNGNPTGFVGSDVMASMYQYFVSKQRSIFIQVANGTQITNSKYTTPYAAAKVTMAAIDQLMGVNGCEPLDVYASVATPAQVGAWNTAIKANPIPGGVGTAPAVTTSPIATGSATEGAILSCDDGAASGNPTPTATRKWQVSATGTSGWSDIAAATSPTYTVPVGTYTGQYIACLVDWGNGVSPDATARTNVIGPIVVAGSAATFITNPTFSGPLQEGAVETAVDGTFVGTPTPSLTRQWQTSPTGVAGTWTDIPSATGITYIPPSGSAGTWLRLHEHISNSGGVDDAWAPKQGPIASGATPTNPGPAVVTIVSPQLNVTTANQVIQVRATHPYGIASVEVSIAGGAWQPAVYNADVDLWELHTTLSLGLTTISVRATDAF